MTQQLTFGSLFAGIGGFDLGLERAGMRCEWQVEKDDYASLVLQKHWPRVRRWREVETFPPSDGESWGVDVISAGVPCQPVSQAGKRKGVLDERWMWGECLRIVATLMPRVFVAENPSILLRDDRGRTISGIIKAISALGYVCEWGVVSASDVGAPHRRQRVFLVAYTNEQRRKGCLEPGGMQGVEQARKESSGSRELGRSGRSSLDAATGVGDCLWGRFKTDGSLQKLFGTSRVHWSAEPVVGRVAHGVPSRVDRLRCLGNAVVPQVVEIIGRAIVAHHERSEKV